jgi:hypothetical protein
MPAGLFARSRLPGVPFGWRFFASKRCLHPCRGALRGGTKPVVSLTLNHRLQAGMPPASDSNALIWFFVFAKFFCTNGYDLPPRLFCLLDPQPHDSTFSIKFVLSHLPVQAEGRHFRKQLLRGHTLLYSHDPPKTAKNQQLPSMNAFRGRTDTPSGYGVVLVSSADLIL